jgi:hypothetical protein
MTGNKKVSSMVKNPDITLAAALRSARLDEALKTDVVMAGREADYLRLSLLQDHLQPIFDDIPPHVDMFDIGLIAGERPRLWIDMVSFVEMNPENKNYRFYKDSFDGRKLLFENNNPVDMMKIVTQYIARRLVSREKLIETDSPSLLLNDLTQTSEHNNNIATIKASSFKEAVVREKAFIKPKSSRAKFILPTLLVLALIFLAATLLR